MGDSEALMEIQAQAVVCYSFRILILDASKDLTVKLMRSDWITLESRLGKDAAVFGAGLSLCF